MLCPLYSQRQSKFKGDYGDRCEGALSVVRRKMSTTFVRRPCDCLNDPEINKARMALHAWDCTVYPDANAALNAADAALLSLMDPQQGLHLAIKAKRDAQAALSSGDVLNPPQALLVSMGRMGTGELSDFARQKLPRDSIHGFRRDTLEVAGPFRAGVIIFNATINRNSTHASLCDVFHYLPEAELTRYTLQAIQACDHISVARQRFADTLSAQITSPAHTSLFPLF